MDEQWGIGWNSAARVLVDGRRGKWEKRESWNKAERVLVDGRRGKAGGKMRGFGFRIFYFITKILKCLKSHVLRHFN